MKTDNPKTRFESIVTQELADEILIYDSKIDRAFCLNQTLAEVWKLADGSRTSRQISQAMSKKFSSNVNEDFVLFALEELSRENLLTKEFSATNAEKEISRREIIRRIGLSSMIALPMITAVLAPQSAQAASICPSTGTACRCVYTSIPGTTSCVNTDPLVNQGCASASCICFYGNPAFACSEVNPTTFVCGGVCQN